MTLNNALDDLYADGYTANSVTAAASAVGELVRYLNHATMPANAGVTLPYPSNIARVLCDLDSTMLRLPQTLHQLAVRLESIADDTTAVTTAVSDAVANTHALRSDLAAAALHANQIPARTAD